MMAHAWIANSLDDKRWVLSMEECLRIVAPMMRILARYFPMGGSTSDFALLIVALIAVYGPRLMMRPDAKEKPDQGQTVDAEYKDVTDL